MNVMVYNKYKELLMGLNIEVMKSLEGVYNVDEIIDTFTNFYFDKMILDITAIRDYQNTDNLQKLAMNINMENVILLLDDNPETDSNNYLSKLISLGIYNFTRNANGINYLLVHPHTYRDVVNIHNLEDLDPGVSEDKSNVPSTEETVAPVEPVETIETLETNAVENNTNESKNTYVTKEEKKESFVAPPVSYAGKLRIIGFKNVTAHAGSTSLIYMLKKMLGEKRKVAAVEVNKVDFLYFNDRDMVSTTTPDLLKEIMKRNSYDIIFVDLNDYEDAEICTEVYYLIEPSTIMINKLLKRNKGVLEKLRGTKVILNRCLLSSQDIATFEYETKLKVVYSIPPFDDRQDSVDALKKFINKINL